MTLTTPSYRSGFPRRRFLLGPVGAGTLQAQIPPTTGEIAAYTGLHAAAASGDVAEIERVFKAGADIEARDSFGRTPLMIAAYRKDLAAARALIQAWRQPQRAG